MLLYFFHGFNYGSFCLVTDTNILVLPENVYFSCNKYLRICYILYYFAVSGKKIRLQDFI